MSLPVKISPQLKNFRRSDFSLTHLDRIRPWLEEWSDEERHTRSISGMLIDE